MTIRQLIAKLQGLPPDMEIFIDDGNMLSPVCCESAGVTTAMIGESLEESEIFILEPCFCQVEEEAEEDESFNLN